MKKFYLYAALAITGQFTSAQSLEYMETGILKPVGEKIIKSSDHALLVNDTLLQYFYRSTQFYIIYAQKGYFFGTGWQGPQKLSTETANHYDSIGLASVSEVLFLAGAKEIVGSPDSISAKIYRSASDTTPNGTAIRSGKISMSAVDTAMPGFTSIPLTKGTANVSGPFLVAIEYGSMTNDTLGILTNNPYGDGQGEKRARLFVMGIYWQAAQEANGQINCDAMIFPVVGPPQGFNEFYLGTNIAIKEPYPNPAGNCITIGYQLTRADNVSITVFDLNGKVHFETGSVHHNTGSYSVDVNTSGMPQGTYYYSLVANGKSAISKFTVNR